MLATMLFAGLRIGELCELRWRDVNLAAGRLTVGRAKTDAGVREVTLLPTLRDELAALKAGTDAPAEALVFATRNGGPQNPSNVRIRVLTRAATNASERLEADRATPLPDGLTPHSLRRTFASVLYALGRSPVDVMDQLGHTDPKLALRIYARAMRRDDAERERLRALVGGADWARMGTGAESEAPDRVDGVDVSGSTIPLPGA